MALHGSAFIRAEMYNDRMALFPVPRPFVLCRTECGSKHTKATPPKHGLHFVKNRVLQRTEAGRREGFHKVWVSIGFASKCCRTCLSAKRWARVLSNRTRRGLSSKKTHFREEPLIIGSTYIFVEMLGISNAQTLFFRNLSATNECKATNQFARNIRCFPFIRCHLCFPLLRI